MEKLIDRRGSEMSMGQKQRAAVLRAIAHDPQVVLADEPTSNLGQEDADLTFALLRRWHGGELAADHRPADHPRTLIFVCHDLRTTLRYAGHVLVLGKDHRLADSFVVRDWRAHAPRVNALLGTDIPSHEVEDHSP